ncbi:hypothetical protein TNCV_3236471 [Trichonephila clavipes]|nr:hypothetical protein TNCV_3236471 [Trichonephila clavipes]
MSYEISSALVDNILLDTDGYFHTPEKCSADYGSATYRLSNLLFLPCSRHTQTLQSSEWRRNLNRRNDFSPINQVFHFGVS